jgi:hypothetical protein
MTAKWAPSRVWVVQYRLREAVMLTVAMTAEDALDLEAKILLHGGKEVEIRQFQAVSR